MMASKPTSTQVGAKVIQKPSVASVPKSTTVQAPPVNSATSRMLFWNKDPKNSWMDLKRYGCWRPEQVLDMIKNEPGSIFILDVRGVSYAETSTDASHKRKFRNAFRQPPVMFGPAGTDLTLEFIHFAHPEVWTKLLKAKYVVVHCAECADRSPAMMASLHTRLEVAEHGTTAGRHPEQVIGLMAPGWYGMVAKPELAADLAQCTVTLTPQDAEVFKTQGAILLKAQKDGKTSDHEALMKSLALAAKPDFKMA